VVSIQETSRIPSSTTDGKFILKLICLAATDLSILSVSATTRITKPNEMAEGSSHSGKLDLLDWDFHGT